MSVWVFEHVCGVHFSLSLPLSSNCVLFFCCSWNTFIIWRYCLVIYNRTHFTHSIVALLTIKCREQLGIDNVNLFVSAVVCDWKINAFIYVFIENGERIRDMQSKLFRFFDKVQDTKHSINFIRVLNHPWPIIALASFDHQINQAVQRVAKPKHYHYFCRSAQPWFPWFAFIPLCLVRCNLCKRENIEGTFELHKRRWLHVKWSFPDRNSRCATREPFGICFFAEYKCCARCAAIYRGWPLKWLFNVNERAHENRHKTSTLTLRHFKIPVRIVSVTYSVFFHHKEDKVV